MDPLEGRIVLHGHMYENGPITLGPIEEEVVSSAADELMRDYSNTLGESLMCYHGLLTLKFLIGVDGSVTNIRVLINRVKQLEGDASHVDEIIKEVVARVERLRFPSRAHTTEVLLPLGFGNNLGELR